MLCLGTEAIRQAAGVRPGESSQMPRRRYVGEHTLCDPLPEGAERCCDRQSANEAMTALEVPSSQMLCHPARFLCAGTSEHHCQFENAMAQRTGCHSPVFRSASVFMLPWEFPRRCAAKLPGDAVLFPPRPRAHGRERFCIPESSKATHALGEAQHLCVICNRASMADAVPIARTRVTRMRATNDDNELSNEPQPRKLACRRNPSGDRRQLIDHCFHPKCCRGQIEIKVSCVRSRTLSSATERPRLAVRARTFEVRLHPTHRHGGACRFIPESNSELDATHKRVTCWLGVSITIGVRKVMSGGGAACLIDFTDETFLDVPRSFARRFLSGVLKAEGLAGCWHELRYKARRANERGWCAAQ